MYGCIAHYTSIDVYRYLCNTYLQIKFMRKYILHKYLYTSIYCTCYYLMTQEPCFCVRMLQIFVIYIYIYLYISLHMYTKLPGSPQSCVCTVYIFMHEYLGTLHSNKEMSIPYEIGSFQKRMRALLIIDTLATSSYS